MRKLIAVLSWLLPCAGCSLLASDLGEMGNYGENGQHDDGGAPAAPIATEDAGVNGTAPEGGPDDDGGGTDGGTDGASTGVPGPIVQDSFDQGSTCAGWTTTGNASASAPGRTGAQSCKLCVAGSPPSISKVVPNTVPGSYRMVAWVRNETDQGRNATILVRMAGGVEIDAKYYEFSDTWQQMTLDIDLASALPAGLEFAIEDAASSTGCFFVDDLEIIRLP